MFGKDEETGMTTCDPARRQLTFLTSKFWHCWTNSHWAERIQWVLNNDGDSFHE
jgi:hypothetical protein